MKRFIFLFFIAVSITSECMAEQEIRMGTVRRQQEILSAYNEGNDEYEITIASGGTVTLPAGSYQFRVQGSLEYVDVSGNIWTVGNYPFSLTGPTKFYNSSPGNVIVLYTDAASSRGISLNRTSAVGGGFCTIDIYMLGQWEVYSSAPSGTRQFIHGYAPVNLSYPTTELPVGTTGLQISINAYL